MITRLNHLHTVGCVLVVMGFVWLLFAHFSIRLAGPAVMMDGYPAVQETNQYSAREVREHVRLTTAEISNRIPSLVPPGLMMLAGAILMEFAFRKAKKSE